VVVSPQPRPDVEGIIELLNEHGGADDYVVDEWGEEAKQTTTTNVCH
jgi:hypothetical protein